MSFISDFVVDSFLEHYRLGKNAAKPKQAMHFSLQLDMQEDYHEGRQERDHFIKEVSHGYEVVTYSNGLVGTEASFATLSEEKVPNEHLKDQDGIRIVVISDTHEREGALGILPTCDILIHSGDILMSSSFVSPTRAKQKYAAFNQWLGEQPATHKIIIGGNHDCILDGMPEEEVKRLFSHGTYLCNSGVEAKGLYIWGSPASKGASHNKAFQSKEFNTHAADTLHALNAAKQAVDILVTHGTCTELQHIAQPRLMHISGHYHARHGVFLHQHSHKKSRQGSQLLTVCAPIMDCNYDPNNLTIVLDVKKHIPT